MKKALSLVLIIAIFISCFSTVVSAYEAPMMEITTTKTLHDAENGYHKENAQNVLIQYVDDVDVFVNALKSAIANCDETFDLEPYNMPTYVYYEISDYLFYGMPEAFNVYQVGCSYYPTTGKLSCLAFTYSSFADTASEYAVCFDKINESANKLLDGIKGNSALNDEQKLLLLHDRLATWNSYGYPANTTQIEGHTAYGALVNRKSVCQGYAMAYMYLLNQVGIESYYCSSATLNHGWNIVILNGERYHVDVTWDDPTPDRIGGVRHENFLRSSVGIISTDHEALDFDFSPTDTKYDNYFWQNSYAEFQVVDNDVYYIDNNAGLLKRYDNLVLYDVNALWPAGFLTYWDGNFACLESDGKSLFYSQPKSIYRFDLQSGTSEVIYTPNTSTYQSIFGFSYIDKTITCTISDSPNYIIQQMTIPYEYTYKPDVIYGDANGDGRINGKDYGVLLQYLNGWDVKISSEGADVNNDGRVNGRDYGILLQYLNGWDVILGPRT